MPRGGERAAEVLDAALRLSSALVGSKRAKPAAAVLGSRRGRRTADRGPDYFKKIAAMRKRVGRAADLENSQQIDNTVQNLACC